MQEILDQLNIKADVINYKTNGFLATYSLRLKPGGTVKKLESHLNEIALGIRSRGIPVVKLIPEEGIISIEALIKDTGDVKFKDIISNLHKTNLFLPVILGQEYGGNPLICDITKMPHLLVAGTTGSGKSVLLHSIICSLLLQNNSSVQLALVDPKNVEFSFYQDIKQLKYPISYGLDQTYVIINDLKTEMDKRFKLMSKYSCNSIQEYNKIKKPIPYIVLIIDEFADFALNSKNIFHTHLASLAQKSRACGIHIVIATQRPSASVVNGLIKANFPTVVGFRSTSGLNSRIILDELGAENLLGRGDGLIKSDIHNTLRFKGAFINNEDIKSICANNKKSKIERFIKFIKDVR